MLNIKSVIQQLSEEEFKGIAEKLKSGKADKFYTLLNYYRTNNIPDDVIIQKLDVTSNAFYVLKSRLFEKIQEHLLDKQVGPKTDILRKLVTIPSLLFETQPDISIAILKKLEKDLLENDMPYELTTVYSALKKLHLHSDKYYEYTQLYNKHVAYTLSLDKAEDLVADFIINLGNYYGSRDEMLLEVFTLIKKEMSNLSRLYESHHLQVFKHIVDASTAIFLPLEDTLINDDPIEDILDSANKIISQYPKDSKYQYMVNVIDYLYFEYYNNLGLHKQADQYFGLLNVRMPSFLYYTHFCVSSKFLISKVERYLRLNIEDQLVEENEKSFEKHNSDKQDVPNYVNYVIYVAASKYYADKAADASKLLSNLLNDISFKNHVHFEIEIK
ncbi:MAG TPA: hypothetical protein EYN38_09380, partial [Flavobacteriales bacterium]|nr:hypothetical protein [Flavobacteriales bacterium]